MASSSPVKYDVFLSFRGEDTRDGFTSHLNAALCRRKIETFIDYELKRGDEISPSLLKAIEGSKISIIVFSQRYASSKWCLEELVKILDCKKKNGQIVIPVFYRIDPSDVRKQTGTFGDAFAMHEVQFRDRPEMLQRWRSALTEASNLCGFDSNAIRRESKLIETIIEHILKRLNDMSSSDNKNLVGIAKKIEKIKSLLFDGSTEVCKVGIWGMGGMGKTTLAKTVFNKISSEFEASHFIQNVREASNKNQLPHLQKELHSAIFEDRHLHIELTFTKERLKRKKVLIVFDDVTDLKQIRELIGDLQNLGFGSGIIITTRDKKVLKNCGLNDSTIYEVKGLYSDESLRLFKQYAFKQNHPIDEDYLKLSTRVINYAKGLPLALEVLGCFLLGREKFEWESALGELKKSPNEVIQAVLKISYDGLSDKEKTLFLDIACFFKRWNKYLVGTIGSHIGVSVLVDKALITISEHNTIGMHDLIQEMGWEIVRQEPVNKLGQRTRLWHHDDVYLILKKNMGTDKIRGMLFDMDNMREIHLNPHAFSDMANLNVLIANILYSRCNNMVHGFDNIEFDFSELRCLCWDHYPFPSLPKKFCLENLVVLKMCNSNLEQLWMGTQYHKILKIVFSNLYWSFPFLLQDLAPLKYIDLSNSNNLLRVPDLSEAQNLESLILEGCKHLFEITPPSRNLDKLVNLNLRNCKSLVSLPVGIQSKSLKVVILSDCSKLKTAPRISCNMKELFLDGTAIKRLSSSIESPSRLVELNLKNCLSLESLPSSVCNLTSLRKLDLSGLSNLKMVPEFPSNILELNLDGTAIKELSSSIGKVSSLTRLSLRNCSSLESLPNDICKLKFLKYLFISGSSKIHRLPEDIGNLESLKVLVANDLREVPLFIERLKNLQDLSLERCKSQGLTCILSPISSGCLLLERINLNHCNLSELPHNFGQLSSLKFLELAGNNFETLPTSIMNLSKLSILNIKFCNRLQYLPKLPCKIQNLEAEGCELLKTLSGFIIPSYGYLLSFTSCLNVDWKEIRNILDDALVDNYSDRAFWHEEAKCRVGRPEGHICFPGSEIPGFFGIQSRGSRIALPQRSLNHKCLGFVFCAIVGIDGHTVYHMNSFQYKLCYKFNRVNKTICMKEISVDGLGSINSDHIIMGYNCSLSGKFTCNMEAFFDFTCSLFIKKCGIHLLFAQEFESLSRRLEASNFFKGEPSSRDNFELVKSMMMSKAIEQVVSNNSANSCNNNGGGGVAEGIFLQQSHAGSDGVYGRGNRGTGNMPEMENRVSASPIRNRGPGAIGGTGLMEKVGNAFGQGIGDVLPLMYPQSFAFDPRIGAPIKWMGNYRGCLGALTPPFSRVLSRGTNIDEEVAHSNKRLKSSNFCEGEPSSRSHPYYTSLEMGAFPQDFVKSHPFNPLGWDQFPQDKTVGSPFINISDSDEDNNGDLVKSQPFTPLDLNEFSRDSIQSPIIIISDSDEDNDG
ncbi:disease resistance-like protein DSC1 [Mangifera indica]|uniref:disease resistance-like protein DSC1 n=1 Tax=Mangifera indica TaxID=29780 RepID=UPI001CFBB457|nr:disease resistance-like protein DSC1 [Mangifera indica]